MACSCFKSIIVPMSPLSMGTACTLKRIQTVALKALTQIHSSVNCLLSYVQIQKETKSVL